MTTMANVPFPLLLASGPAAEHREKLMTFGRLAGCWHFTGTHDNGDGSQTADRGEIQVGWILGGSALQDVWMETHVSEGRPDLFGTTVRFYDPAIDAWRSVWCNPRTGTMRTFIGRETPEGIAFEGHDGTGRPIRWAFSEMTGQSFLWRAHREVAPGDWQVYEELRAIRIPEKQS
jgi:hypothetical protein